MRLLRHLFPAVLILCALPNCGARPPAPSKTAPTPSSPRATPQAERDPEPGNLLLVGRVRGYREWLGIEGEATPPMVAWLQQELAKESEILGEVDWDGPTEFVAVFDPVVDDAKTTKTPPHLVQFAVAHDDLADQGDSADDADDDDADDDDADDDANDDANDDDSEDEHDSDAKSPLDGLAVALAEPLRTYVPEKYLGMGFKPIGSGAFAKKDCLVTPPVDDGKARYICATELSAAKRLQGYLTRRLPRERLSSSPIFAELRLAPVRHLFAPLREELLTQLGRLTGSAGPTAAVAKTIGTALLVEATAWVDAAETLRFEAGPDSSGAFRFTGRLGLNSTKPWLFQSYLATARAIHEPPAPFFALAAGAKSIGYQFGLPEERSAQLQAALSALGKAALEEYGPVSRAAADSLDARQGKTVDRVVETWLELVNAPCFRAEHVVWASGEPDLPIAPNAPRRIPFQDVVREYFGSQVIATPTQSACPASLDALMGTFVSGYALLPKKERAQFPIQISHPKPGRLSGDNALSSWRITVSKKALDTAFNDKKDASSAGEFGWRAATKPAVLSILVARDLEHRGTDWFAFGFDEKELVRALGRVSQPPAASLRERPDLAQLSKSKPIQYARASLGYQSLIRTLLRGDDESMRTVRDLFLDASFESNLHVSGNQSTGELSASYAVSQRTMEQLRKILHWDKPRLEALAKQIEESSKQMQTSSKATLSGPVGIVRRKK